MPGYDDIDSLLEAWTGKRDIELARERRVPFRRFFYHSGAQPPHTFQIVLEPEINGEHRVDLHLIEGPVDKEIHKKWHLNKNNFGKTMSDIETFMHNFFT
jgi:hypothetical protein